MLEQQRSTFVVSGMGVLMEAKKSSTTGLLLMTSPSGTKSLLLLLLDRVVVVGLLLFVVGLLSASRTGPMSILAAWSSSRSAREGDVNEYIYIYNKKKSSLPAMFPSRSNNNTQEQHRDTHVIATRHHRL